MKLNLSASEERRLQDEVGQFTEAVERCELILAEAYPDLETASSDRLTEVSFAGTRHMGLVGRMKINGLAFGSSPGSQRWRRFVDARYDWLEKYIPMENGIPSHDTFASSAESVGRFWLGKFSELMKQCDLDGFKLLEAVRFSHGQFGFVVEAFHNA